jgi:matrixin
MRTGIASGVALYVSALAVGACTANDPGSCFEPTGTSYAFHVPYDTTRWFRWPSNQYPVRVYAENTGALQVNTDSAITTWLGAFHCGELSMVRWSDSTNADVIVRNPPFPPPVAAGVRVVAADSINGCQGRTDVDTISADTIARPIRSYVWPIGADPAGSEACFHFVTAHELGHALGLFMHSLNPDDLMYSKPKRRVVTDNDRYTIQILYHSIPPMVPGPR